VKLSVVIPDEQLDELAERIAARVTPAAATAAPERWQTVGLPELAEMLGRSERWCREQTKAAHDPLPFLLLGDGSRRFDVDDVRAWARRRRVPADGEGEPRLRLAR
jgi:hypothetical protein